MKYTDEMHQKYMTGVPEYYLRNFDQYLQMQAANPVMSPLQSPYQT